MSDDLTGRGGVGQDGEDNPESSRAVLRIQSRGGVVGAGSEEQSGEIQLTKHRGDSSSGEGMQGAYRIQRVSSRGGTISKDSSPLDNWAIGWKLLLLVALLALPTGVLLYLLVQEKNIAINFSAKEIHGVSYTRPSVAILGHLGIHGWSESTTTSEDLAKVIQGPLEQLRGVHGRLAGVMDLDKELAALEKAVAEIKPSGYDENAVRVVQAFIARINDVSNLILDPDLDSYYMMDASMLILPEQYPRLAEMARQLLAIAPRPGDGMDEIFVETDLRARISAEIGAVRAGLMRHSRGFDVARENNPSRILGPETFEVSGRMVTQVEQFLASVEKLLAQGKITATDREALLSGSRAALAAMLNLWNHSLEKLDQLLGYRVDGFKSRKIQYLTGVGFLLLAAGLVAFYIGRRLNSRITQLTRIAHRIADNAEIDAEVDNDLESLASRDEVGDLASTLAVMTVKLRRSFDEIQAKRLELEQANQTLEDRVARRTAEIQAKSEQLEKALEQLEKTKDQLIVQEKMASLGNLTAGIAHEIKNPLNFVNNFAELTVEIASEIREILDGEREKLSAKVIEDLEMCLDDLQQNVSKIHEHGKRADSIVKGMLQHSRGASGEFVLANINNLLDEYVGLAYHGMRAQDKTFNVTIEKSFDKSLPDIPVVPQDITRVFLNIVNNGCYAANQKKLSGQAPENFMPTISVSTERLPDDRVEIRIRDNGTGMPESVRSKIFEPFFTTKPTGIGTGLGLSLSYDIVVKEHGGSLQVETTEGEGTEFIITLPMKREIATA